MGCTMKIFTDSTELWDKKITIEHSGIKFTISNGDKCVYVTCEKGCSVEKLSSLDVIISKIK